MEDISYEAATAADLQDILALLQRCDLPTEDLESQHLRHFLVCRHAGRVVGTVGFELHGELGLLRSLAVAPEHRGRGVGHALWARIRGKVADAGIRRLYLITTTADRLFSRWGFARMDRRLVADAIQATREYSVLCPSTAVVMAMDVGATEQRVS